MDAVDILKVCIRRWYVMLPILLGAAGVSYQLAQAQETTYTAAASYGLVQPSLTPDDRTDANPLGSAGDILVGAALEAQLNSRETQELLGGGDTRGWGPGEVSNGRSYDVRIPQFETTYEVRAWGEDEDEVRKVVERVIKAAPGITDELQVRAGVPPTQRYRPFVLAPTQVGALPSSGWVKLALAVMGVGFLMGAAWSVVVDRVLRWRRASRQPAARAGDTREEHVVPAGHDPVRAAAGPAPRSDPTNGTAHQVANERAKDMGGEPAVNRQASGEGSRPNGSAPGRPNVRPSGKPTSVAPRRLGRKASGRR